MLVLAFMVDVFIDVPYVLCSILFRCVRVMGIITEPVEISCIT
jgi:hypothetical protein